MVAPFATSRKKTKRLKGKTRTPAEPAESDDDAKDEDTFSDVDAMDDDDDDVTDDVPVVAEPPKDDAESDNEDDTWELDRDQASFDRHLVAEVASEIKEEGGSTADEERVGKFAITKVRGLHDGLVLLLILCHSSPSSQNASITTQTFAKTSTTPARRFTSSRSSWCALCPLAGTHSRTPSSGRLSCAPRSRSSSPCPGTKNKARKALSDFSLPQMSGKCSPN